MFGAQIPPHKVFGSLGIKKLIILDSENKSATFGHHDPDLMKTAGLFPPAPHYWCCRYIHHQVSQYWLESCTWACHVGVAMPSPNDVLPSTCWLVGFLYQQTRKNGFKKIAWQNFLAMSKAYQIVPAPSAPLMIHYKLLPFSPRCRSLFTGTDRWTKGSPGIFDARGWDIDRGVHFFCCGLLWLELQQDLYRGKDIET